jgi:adenosine deaminase
VLTPNLETFIRRMPKVELHVHLEGSIAPQTLFELAQQNRVDIPVRTVAELERLFCFRNFGDFLNVFMSLARAIVTGEDFARLAYELGSDLARQQVRYAEVMISPMQYINRGMDLAEALEGASAGFARVERETGTVIKLALDYGRQYAPENAWQVLEIARAAMPIGVVGWSIGGNEIGFPPEPFAEVFAAARKAGLGLMAHAGEVVGPPSIWGAVDALGATRIGHGIHCVGDQQLIEHLREQQIVLDICPSSNVLTGAVASWEEHPLRQLFDAGVPVTVNSDDPTFFATTLTDEYRRVAGRFGFTADELVTMVRTATQAAFLPPIARDALLHRIDDEIATLRAELGV